MIDNAFTNRRFRASPADVRLCTYFEPLCAFGDKEQNPEVESLSLG